jgi:hypothetical protein
MHDFAKYDPQSRKQLHLDLELAKFVARCSVPFALLEHPGFKDLIHAIDPRINIKNRTTYSKAKLNLVYNNLKAAMEKELKADLPHVGHVAFTTDIWTSRNNDPFLSLTLHYVTKDFVLKKFSLEHKHLLGRHTGAYIAKFLDEMISAVPGLEPSTTVTCVHDSGANMIAAVRDSEKITNSFTCLDHILNTVLSSSIAETKIIGDLTQEDLVQLAFLRLALKSATDLASYIHRSSTGQQQLQQECRTLGGIETNFSNLFTSFHFVKFVTFR